MAAVRWYAAAAVMLIAALALAALLAWRFFSELPEAARFLAPGVGEIEIGEPGPHVIWHEYRTVFQGRAYEGSAAMPNGVRYRVRDPGGAQLEVAASRGASVEGRESRRASQAKFIAVTPGRHRVEVEGAFEPRVMAVQKDLLWPALRAIGTAVAVAVLGTGGAAALALLGFLRSVPSLPRSAAGILDPERERSLKTVAAVVYGLQAASLLFGITLIAAVMINYLKRAEVAGTWLDAGSGGRDFRAARGRGLADLPCGARLGRACRSPPHVPALAGYFAAARTTPSRRPRGCCFRRGGATRSRTKFGSANTPSWVSPL
jgi:hypothetical protein